MIYLDILKSGAEAVLLHELAFLVFFDYYLIYSSPVIRFCE
jgi:hypothetical protein